MYVYMCIYIYIYIYIYTSVLLCIYMHREFGAICKLDLVVELIWSKACITKAITKAITTSIVKAIASCLTRSKSGSYRGVDLVESSVTKAIQKLSQLLS